ncbi:MAG: 3-isopropylmalate dehydratase small subunit [Candidatus Neomarinimicrobiota bacterium]|jgi:3-isopropylmalate/(R)-2-methylmalate dehydratase small subunit
MEGKAHVYKKDHINTDEIIPARYLNSDQESELAMHAMEDLDVDFIKKVKAGDFIVSGADFGCGSSREHAVWALRGAGIRAVIANSFARIFYRNCINNGFLAIECQDAVGKVKNDDLLKIDLADGKIVNLTRQQTYQFQPLPGFAREIIEAGGLMEKIKKELK